MSLFDKFGKKPRTDTPQSVPTPRPIGFSAAPPEWAEQRGEFYDDYFGGAAMVAHEIISQIPTIHVYIYPPHGSRNYSTLITSGVSDLPMPMEPGQNLPIEKRRVELFMRVPRLDMAEFTTDMPWQVQMLRFIGKFPFENSRPLVEFKTFTLGEVPESDVLKHVVLMPPFYEAPPFTSGLTHLDGTRVSFLWLDLITDAELEAKLSGGSEALMQIFKRSKHTPILNVGRPSYV
ncbi:hypothetical protein CCAX7_47420 [Capsulimonas corticalis]|uniref:Uncharacterized protein n=1 Tax=Capsulimonas corticalis TaxID=2219043 RepID=A0A402CQH5_9BACT|nr:suppressor of fused domain protein [Capsulimonas corticalis]BDI32691.1 hypothetical protein CCAX7_47420 [Capsulimonas corticalis]